MTKDEAAALSQKYHSNFTVTKQQRNHGVQSPTSSLRCGIPSASPHHLIHRRNRSKTTRCLLDRGIISVQAKEDIHRMRLVILMFAVCFAIIARADDINVMNELHDLWPNAGWPTNTSFACPTKWPWVTCNGARVQSLQIGSTPLSGPIPTIIGQLSGLTSRWLRGNLLTGAIPTELGKLTSLTQLVLQSNPLNSSIPSELGKLTSLEYLFLDNNHLTGAIPSELSNLRSLTWL